MIGHCRRLRLGTDVESDERVFLSAKRLETHLHVLGPPGVGKTRFLFSLFQQLARNRDATVIVVNPKGDFCHMARDWAITHNLVRRLVIFDPTDSEFILGFNPLRPNGLPPVTQVKAVREAFRAAFGQSSFEATPQLARLLFMALFVVRELGWGLVEALELLQPGSPVRHEALRRLRDDRIRRSLEYFDSLRDARQEELAASTVARMEAFINDPMIRRVLTAPNSLDLDTVTAERQLFLWDIRIDQPFRIDDVRLLNKLFVNAVVGHVLGRHDHRSPVYLILDEAHLSATDDLSNALALGRELGLHCILAHQDLDQLRDEDDRGHLLSTVKACARTRVVFGGLPVEALEPIVKELFIDQFDPYAVKDQITSLEQEIVEERREVIARAENWAAGRGWSRDIGFGQSRDWHVGRANAKGGSRGDSSVSGSSYSSSEDWSDGFSVLPSGDVIEISGSRSGATSADTSSHAQISQESWQSAKTRQRGGSKSRQFRAGVAGSSQSGGGVTRTTVPFQAVRKRRVVSSREFWKLDEFLIVFLQRTQAQLRSHFVIKVPSAPAIFVRGLYIKTPRASERLLSWARARIFDRPFYRRLDAIEEISPWKADQSDRTRLIPVYGHAAKAVSYKRKRRTDA